MALSFYRFCEFVFVNLGRDLHVREGTLERKEMYTHGCASLGFQYELIGNGSLIRLMRIALAVVDSGLDHPLLIEGRETCRFIEQLMNILICAIGFHLQIYNED